MDALTIHTEPSYEVLFGRGLLARAGARMARILGGRKTLIVTDDGVPTQYLETVRESCAEAGFDVSTFAFPHGEKSKSMETLSDLLNGAAERELTRADSFVSLGGGVVGDLTGLAAALYMRGVDCVQLPTTLLAMVDSSVGGKTAVNLPAGKNLCGAFLQPRLVICDTETLDTLSPEVYREGMAEVVKYGAIRAPQLLSDLAQGAPIEPIIRTCVQIKGDLVAQDERDTGLRQLLNFGHTFGHAMERLSDFSLFHGEAVGVGMLIAAYAAQARGFCAPGVYEELRTLLAAQKLPLTTHFSAAAIARCAMRDKKMQGARLTLVLPKARGDCALVPVEASALLELIEPCAGVVTGV